MLKRFLVFKGSYDVCHGGWDNYWFTAETMEEVTAAIWEKLERLEREIDYLPDWIETVDTATLRRGRSIAMATGTLVSLVDWRDAGLNAMNHLTPSRAVAKEDDVPF